MSRALLAKRLRKLIESGVIRSADGEYRLTPSGEELGEVVVRLGEWGQRWAEPVRRANLDSRLLMWDMRRRIALDRLPDRRVVLRFDFRGVPPGRCPKVFWLVLSRAEADLCIVEPGYEVDLFVDADLAAFSRVWLGEVPIRQVIREGGIKLLGAREAVRDFPSWLLLSTLAEVPRPAEAIQRRVA
jgi:HxlR-like helix-turn-helix